MVLSKPLHAEVEPPPVEAELPPVDERLVQPETRYEMYDGEVVHVPPVDFVHGGRHSMVARLIGACVRPEFCVTTNEDGRQGIAEGLAEGWHEGVREGVQRSLLQLLDARSIPLDSMERARILDERDLRRLERWFARAVHCASIADMLPIRDRRATLRAGDTVNRAAPSNDARRRSRTSRHAACCR